MHMRCTDRKIAPKCLQSVAVNPNRTWWCATNNLCSLTTTWPKSSHVRHKDQRDYHPLICQCLLPPGLSYMYTVNRIPIYGEPGMKRKSWSASSAPLLVCPRIVQHSGKFCTIAELSERRPSSSRAEKVLPSLSATADMREWLWVLEGARIWASESVCK